MSFLFSELLVSPSQDDLYQSDSGTHVMANRLEDMLIVAEPSRSGDKVEDREEGDPRSYSVLSESRVTTMWKE